MKKLYVLFLITIIFIVGCQPSETAIQTAIAQTKAAIPFSALDLESILITSGDLPTGYEAAQIRSGLSIFSKAAPKPDYFISQSLSYEEGTGGIVEILVYEDIANVKQAYEVTQKTIPGNLNIVNMGEGGESGASYSSEISASLTFFRCHAVVIIQFKETYNTDYVVSYGKRLDKRLMPIVCR